MKSRYSAYFFRMPSRSFTSAAVSAPDFSASASCLLSSAQRSRTGFGTYLLSLIW